MTDQAQVNGYIIKGKWFSGELAGGEIREHTASAEIVTICLTGNIPGHLECRADANPGLFILYDLIHRSLPTISSTYLSLMGRILQKISFDIFTKTASQPNVMIEQKQVFLAATTRISRPGCPSFWAATPMTMRFAEVSEISLYTGPDRTSRAFAGCGPRPPDPSCGRYRGIAIFGTTGKPIPLFPAIRHPCSGVMRYQDR